MSNPFRQVGSRSCGKYCDNLRDISICLVPNCNELKSAGREAAAAGRMLRKWAPVALRALYERDLRRRFCPPALWLAPFEACRPCGAVPQLRA